MSSYNGQPTYSYSSSPSFAFATAPEQQYTANNYARPAPHAPQGNEAQQQLGSLNSAYSPSNSFGQPAPSAPYEYEAPQQFSNPHSAYSPTNSYAQASSASYAYEAPQQFSNLHSAYAPQAPVPREEGDLMDFLDANTVGVAPPRPASTTSSSQPVDLLDDTPPAVVVTPPVSTCTQITVQEEEQALSSLTPELVASQQKILDGIRRRQTISDRDHAMALSLSTEDGMYQQSVYDETRIVPHTPIPQSYNPSGSDAVHPKKHSMKQNRPYKTAAGAASGAVMGGLIMAPVAPLGVILGGVAGGVATRQACKASEKRAQRKWEKGVFQQGADAAMSRQADGCGLV